VTFDPARQCRVGYDARMSAMRRPVTGVTTLAAVIGTLLVACPAPALAQGDTARVTYRTREIVFFAAGRDDGVVVGDTVAVLQSEGATLVLAVVVSTGRRSASARLLTPDAPIALGATVRFPRHPPQEIAAAPTDTAGAAPAPAESTYVPSELPGRAAAASRWRGGLQLEQVASSAGGAPSLTTRQTALGLDLVAPLASALQLRVRTTSRWRSGASATTTGLEGVTALLYLLQLRIAPPEGRWSASLGRFAPDAAPGLGYLDGAQLEVRPAPSQRLGVVAGFVPRVEQLRPSTTTTRAAAYWAFAAGDVFDGAVAAAADWADGAHRRTELSARSFWRPTPGLSLSLYGAADLAVAWRPADKAQITTVYAAARARLPLGFRASLGVESHRAVRIWDTSVALDTTPLPGRLNGLTASLGHDVGGVALEAAGGYLKRTGDPSATLRATFSAARGPFFMMGTGQHGDLFDYGNVTARLFFAQRALPFSASLGGSASATRTANGQMTLWRYSLRPEISRTIGRGLLITFGGDVGRYAGRSSTWLHAGASYRFR